MKLQFLVYLSSVARLAQACAPASAMASTVEDVLLELSKRAAPPEQKKTAIQNVRVFHHDHFSEPKTVVFDESGHITGCKRHVDVTIDGSGKFLIPGLFDSHVHLSSVDGLVNMTSYGVTTALNMNCVDYGVCNALRNQPGLASYLSAGASAIGAYGHHAALSPNKTIVIYPNTKAPQLDDMVSWAFGNGSDFFKITVEPNGPTPEQQNTLIKSTHRMFRRQTMSHAADLNSYSQAEASKSDAIQHVPTDGVMSRSLAAKIKANGQSVTPTMAIFLYALEYPAVGEIIQINNDSSFSTVQENVRRLHQAGVPLLAGTDAVGYQSSDLDVPYGQTLHMELENLVGASLTPAEALRAATSVAAKWHRLYDRGRVEKGLRADLVLLNSNPLLNISNSRDIAKVWVKGVEVDKIAAST